MAAFIDTVKDKFGIEPVCTVLSRFVWKIAPSTYYAVNSRPKAERATREELIEEVILERWYDPAAGREVYGSRKM
ncbi:hypothetical protein KIH74_35150 [Kineosporia sp. J2-2]|uniref:Transposase n=1 Tax=Kineosporia corallincola TaxID=2835133 RepID=A0ABS5TU12_9ACTN|nr:hypothetical protein [Kineosporia corallincola]MBT0774234.1 hypothetical protein [Kineosporia corallincola]